MYPEGLYLQYLTQRLQMILFCSIHFENLRKKKINFENCAFLPCLFVKVLSCILSHLPVRTFGRHQGKMLFLFAIPGELEHKQVKREARSPIAGERLKNRSKMTCGLALSLQLSPCWVPFIGIYLQCLLEWEKGDNKGKPHFLFLFRLYSWLWPFPCPRQYFCL